MRIYDGAVLKVGAALAASVDCCCGDACCSCDTYDSTVITELFSPWVITITLSDYTFCSGDVITITVNIQNPTGSTLPVFGTLSPRIILGNTIRIDPTDNFAAGNFEVQSTSPVATSITYNGSGRGCDGRRVMITYPDTTYPPGASETYVATVLVNSGWLTAGTA